MPTLSTFDRTLLRTALKAAQSREVPSVGIKTDTYERLLGYLAILEEGMGIPVAERVVDPEGAPDGGE